MKPVHGPSFRTCFVGFQVIWNVNHALHTPLMAVTNAISGIIIVGALLQVGSTSLIVEVLSSISVLIATINIVGGNSISGTVSNATPYVYGIADSGYSSFVQDPATTSRLQAIKDI